MVTNTDIKRPAQWLALYFPQLDEGVETIHLNLHQATRSEYHLMLLLRDRLERLQLPRPVRFIRLQALHFLPCVVVQESLLKEAGASSAHTGGNVIERFRPGWVKSPSRGSGDCRTIALNTVGHYGNWMNRLPTPLDRVAPPGCCPSQSAAGSITTAYWPAPSVSNPAGICTAYSRKHVSHKCL